MEKRKKNTAAGIAFRVLWLFLILLAIIAALTFMEWRRHPNNSVLNGLPFFSSGQEAGSGEAAMPIQESGEEVLSGALPVSEKDLITVAPQTASEMISDAVLTDAEQETGHNASLPAIDPSSWEFLLANNEHSVQEYHPEVAALEDVYLDVRIIPAMESFIEAARNQGLEVVLNSGYRSYEEQTWLFENKVAQYNGDEATAATIVARPGTSEHQTGLAADITDGWYEIKKQDLENTALYQWMSTNCQKYGFIVRFPKGKEDITGIIYEPWHFRYVGEEAATYIMKNSLTLEEFLELYET